MARCYATEKNKNRKTTIDMPVPPLLKCPKNLVLKPLRPFKKAFKQPFSVECGPLRQPQKETNQKEPPGSTSHDLGYQSHNYQPRLQITPQMLRPWYFSEAQTKFKHFGSYKKNVKGPPKIVKTSKVEIYQVTISQGSK